MTLSDRLNRLARYPTFIMYVSGVLVACGVSLGWLRLDVGIVVLTTIVGILILVGIAREVHTVHAIIEAQRNELLDRIAQLSQALNDAGITAPKHRERFPYE